MAECGLQLRMPVLLHYRAGDEGREGKEAHLEKTAAGSYTTMVTLNSGGPGGPWNTVRFCCRSEGPSYFTSYRFKVMNEKERKSFRVTHLFGLHSKRDKTQAGCRAGAVTRAPATGAAAPFLTLTTMPPLRC